MKGSIDNKKDIDSTSHAGDRGKNSYIKFKKGRIFVRLLGKEFVSEFLHSFEIGKKFYSFVCLGGLESKGYAPDSCPACQVAKEHFWDPIKELKDKVEILKQKNDAKKAKQLEMEIDEMKKQGKMLITKQTTKFVAVAGEAVKEKIKTKKGFIVEYVPEWETQPKILQLSKIQFDKLTLSIFEKYSFMKTSDDLVNRNLMFVKEAPKGEVTKQNTPVEIVPCDKISKSPKAEGDLPDIDKTFYYKTDAEVKKIMKEFLSGEVEFEDEEVEEEQDNDFEDDDFEDEPEEEIQDDDGETDSVEDEFEDEVEEQPRKKVNRDKGKKKPIGKVKKSSKKKDEEDDEF